MRFGWPLSARLASGSGRCGSAASIVAEDGSGRGRRSSAVMWRMRWRGSAGSCNKANVKYDPRCQRRMIAEHRLQEIADSPS